MLLRNGREFREYLKNLREFDGVSPIGQPRRYPCLAHLDDGGREFRFLYWDDIRPLVKAMLETSQGHGVFGFRDSEQLLKAIR